MTRFNHSTHSRPTAKARVIRENRLSVWWNRVRRTFRCLLIWLIALALGACYINWLSKNTSKVFPPDVAEHIRVLESKDHSPVADFTTKLLINGIFKQNELPSTVLDETTQTREGVKTVMHNRSVLWCRLLYVLMFITFLIAIIIHLNWRSHSHGIVRQSREVIQIKEGYHRSLLAVLLVNIGIALVVFLFSYAGELGVNPYLQLSYNGLFLLSPLALILSTRFSAPLIISGKGCFFH